MATKTKSKGNRKRQRARQLHSEGKSVFEIADELGVAINTARTWLPRFGGPKPDAVSGETLMDFLEVCGVEDHITGFEVNGRRATDNQTRAFYRWRHEEVNPGLDMAERTLIYFSLSFNEFEEWAEENEVSVWASGSAPAWWTDSGDSRLLDDLDSLDPKWRAEAKREGISSGLLTRSGHRRVLTSKSSEGQRERVAA
jgi:hypothetical protein